MKVIDLRSDTVTKPTEKMRQAMAQAEVGDDVYGEDPTMAKLESLAAERFGKEAALFVPSGTMGNQIAVLTHTNRGEEIIVEAEAHVYFYEVGGIGALAGVQTRTIRGEAGVLSPQSVREAIRSEDIHFPETTLICLENTHNRAGGTVVGLKEMAALVEVAQANRIPIHVDGARIFNAAVALGVGVQELTQGADSVMFCLSKGLGAPVGSMLVGSRAWINKARKIRKRLGGGMRQVGILAAAGIVALEEMVDRLAEDHALARTLAEGIAEMPGMEINLNRVQTNIVVFDIGGTGIPVNSFLGQLKEAGILASGFGGNSIRMVTNKDVSPADIDYTLQTISGMIKK